IKTEYATLENHNVPLKFDGIAVLTNIFAVTTACKMNLFLFPFDIQSCTFTLQSPITIKRKPVLYIIDFLMPVFYCLVLDLASFFVESKGGEKLGFKVTLL
ncbi:hypothetical protein DNTS_028687, partial [Danionella cerebrum]